MVDGYNLNAMVYIVAVNAGVTFALTLGFFALLFSRRW